MFSGTSKLQDKTLPGEISFARLLFQLSVFMASFILFLGIHIFFKQLIDHLNVNVVNEQERLLIGELIIQNIQKIETDVYRMAATNGIKAQEIVLQGIDEQISGLEQMLEVLEKGGTIKKQIRLNMQGRDEMIREISYQPRLENDEYILEAINLAPKINVIRLKIDELIELLKQRERARDADYSDKQLIIIKQVKDRLRKFYPMFVRLKENANRLFVHGNQRLIELQQVIEQEQKFYSRSEIGLIILIIIFIMVFGYVSARQIVKSNNQLRIAHDSMETAKQMAEQANKAKSEFLSNMSHELRTPLNAIIGFTQLLDMQIGNDREHASKLQEINNAGKHLLSLINDVLDLAKIESGNLEYNIQSIEVNDVITETLELIRHEAIKKSIRVSHESETDAAYVIADRVRLKQVLLNLMSNAVKYNNNEGSLTVRTEITSGEVKISVIDSGIGIDETKYSEMFRPFSRLGQESGMIDGTGIGLMVTKQLVENMGGRLGFSSKLGAGSVFWIEFTLCKDCRDEWKDNSASKAIVESAVDKPDILDEFETCIKDTSATKIQKILLVEDNLTNQILLEEQIKILGYSVDLANNGLEGIELYESGEYSLILTDCNMPKMDGYEMAKSIRTTERDTDLHIPIVAVTANALEGDIERSLSAGMDDYLSKPIKMLDLQKMISKWLPKNSFSVMKPLNMGDKITSNDPEFCSEKLEDDFLNTGRYLKLMGNDPDRQFDFMGKYVHESKAYTDDLRKSILNKSNADIAYHSYLIKTSAKAIGFNKLEELACQIEEICLSGSDMHDCNVVSEVERCLQHIDNQIDRLSNNNQINQNDV